MSRKWIILTEGHSNPRAGKTACSVIRYRTDEVLAVLDTTQHGKTTQEVFGVGGPIPFVRSLDEAPQANSLLIGIAVSGGKIPTFWRGVIRQAIDRGMDVVSGMHEFLSDDPEFADAAAVSGSQLIDVRKNREKAIARRVGLSDDSLRILTVGHDCSVGKMVAAIEITRGLQRRGRSAKFVATGQTGIMIEGDGVPLDCVVGDFMSGAIEQQILAQQAQHEFLLVEGQGSLVHPSFSGVTLALLHGSAPHGMVLCYEAGRKMIHGLEHLPIPPLAEIRRLNEIMASIERPCPVIGVAVNSRLLSPQQAEDERRQVREELGLPVVDVFRHGSDELVDAVLQLRQRLEV
ncbi:MAG: DUF1611 domain-containing protein [Pirellulaceae bacterium]|nr:DUF1611 domain-containing protein [Pirellulaceae bacterium]